MENTDILIVTDNNIETVGGEQESTKIILENLKDEFSLAVFQPGPLKHKPKNIRSVCSTEKTRVKSIIKKPFLFVKYSYSLYKTIKNLEPKIIHTQAQVSFFLVAFLKKLKLIDYNIQLIHTERGLYKKYSKFITTVFLFFISELHTLVTTTEYNHLDWKKALEERNINIHYEVIPNTAGKLFETYEESKEVNNSNKFVVGFSGRYTEWKDWPLALDIIDKLNHLLGEKLEVRMAVGALDKRSAIETKKMFNELSNNLGNRFVGKININLEEMDIFYYELDLFILTSKPNTESFGRTLIEAMSRKTAVLTTNAGGSEEVVGDKKNVFLNSEQAVKKALVLANNPDILSNIKKANLIRVKKFYSLKNNVNKHKCLYNKVKVIK